MTSFAIGPDAALRLAQLDARIPAKLQLLAPALIRSQLLALLYGSVRRRALDRQTAERQLGNLATVSCSAPPGRLPTSSHGPTPSSRNTSL
jgi:hypothetical protein